LCGVYVPKFRNIYGFGGLIPHLYIVVVVVVVVILVITLSLSGTVASLAIPGVVKNLKIDPRVI